MPVAILLLFTSALALASTAKELPKKLVECPGKTTYVLVEQGKYDPPAYVVPDWDNAREGDQYYGEWNYIHNQPDSVVHCHYEKAGMAGEVEPKVVDIKIPPEVTKCTYFRYEFSCW